MGKNLLIYYKFVSLFYLSSPQRRSSSRYFFPWILSSAGMAHHYSSKIWFKKMAHKGKTTSSIELLSPAGSIESFYAALDAGADAIYLGINKFNARLRADNFSLKTLSYLISHAHKHNRNIYVTINTLIKQNELEEVTTLLYQLEQLGVDAVITQDLGLAHLAKKYFPGLSLHASTQMVIHNNTGVTAAKEAGFKRVILARELSLKEIETIQKKVPAVELEVFIHGALCYSISGLCLASSYLGGLSGNRGRCTQVCRRYYSTGKNAGFYFSLNDFWAIDFIETFKRIGISSLKIEGRMKGAQYVYTVVNVYRKAIDNAAPIESIKEELLNDLGREKTSFLLGTKKRGAIINSSRPSGTGSLIGTVQNKTNSTIRINADRKLFVGDKVRFHDGIGGEGKSVKINKLSSKNGFYTIAHKNISDINNGDYVYLISRKSANLKKREENSTVKPKSYEKNCPFAKKILSRYSPLKKRKKTKNSLYLKFNNIEWLNLVTPDTCDASILQCGQKDMRDLKKNTRLLGKWSQKLIVALPPFLPEKDLPFWKRDIKEIQDIGISRWMCSQPGQKGLIQANNTLYTDASVWCTNRATQKFLSEIGFNTFSYSPEDDILNLKVTGNMKGLFTLFSLVPLFISRVKPPLSGVDFIVDKKDIGFFVKKFDNLYYTFGEQPLGLTHRRDKLNAAGIYNFILDFSFYPPKKKFLMMILDHYNSKTKIPGAMIFNHKDGLK